MDLKCDAAGCQMTSQYNNNNIKKIFSCLHVLVVVVVVVVVDGKTTTESPNKRYNAFALKLKLGITS